MNLKTIADRAGVSTATVSNVINGNYHKVSQKTVEKVQKIIDELNYSPSAAARSLVSNESRIIVLIVPNMMQPGGFGGDPYASQMISLLEEAIRKEGYYTMVRCVDRCIEITQLATTWNADGIIFFGAYPEEVREISSRISKIPVVYTDTYAEDTPIANVGINDYKGGYLSAQYLLKNGHRRIAFAGPDPEVSAVIGERLRGFRAAMKEYGLDLAPEDIYLSATDLEAGRETGSRILKSERGYTAAAAMSDNLALGIGSGFLTNGARVPEDISIIGFDNIRVGRYTNPALTTVSQNLPEKAFLVSKHLFEMIRNKESYTVNEIMDVEIVERQSVKKL